MTNDDQMILLEYNPHSGLFHFNMCYNLRFNHQPDSYGWESIALTYESKARLFCWWVANPKRPRPRREISTKREKRVMNRE